MTEGEMQVALEAALEQLGSVRSVLNRMTDCNTRQVFYHLGAAEGYVKRVWLAMADQWGSTEGQLCPNAECAHDLAIAHSGWWQCPNCGVQFFAGDTESDIEDYHAYPEGHPHATLAKPDTVPVARDLGASWATPKES
jgi:hypothetical protein